MTLTLRVLLGIVAALVASMALYAAAGRKADPDATRKGTRFLLGVGDFLVHWFMWLITPLERASLGLGLGPTFFNFAGLASGAAAGLLLSQGRLELGGWAIALGGVCDILDGRIARALKAASPFGKFLDSTLDRFVEAFAFLGFVWYFADRPKAAFAAAAAICGSLLVSYAQARGESVNISGSGGLMQRAERLVLTCVACLFDRPVSAWMGQPTGTLLYGVLVLIAVGAFATAVYRTSWLARKLAGRDR
jgi:phosphatidylglycerophosphate synthase